MQDQQPTKTTTEPILIIGGTGKTGSRVASRLAALGLPIRPASRFGETRFDWDDSTTWVPALKGATAAYVTYSPDLAVPEAPPRIRNFARLAADHGIGRLVLLSGRGEEEAQRCERFVQETNPAWTVVRASWFSQNFSEAFFLEPLRQGVLALPAGDVREPFVSADDIAEVVARALTEPGHEGKIIEVTGPRLMTFAEAVTEIAQAAGRDLRYMQVPLDAFIQEMHNQQMPAPIISLTRYLFETVLDGRNEYLTDGVQQALGRTPRDFTDYAREVAAAGVWNEPTPARS